MGLIREAVKASQLYVAIFVVSIPASSFSSKYKDSISSNSILSFVNSLFVTDYGIFWLVLAYLAQTMAESFTSSKANARLLTNRLAKLASVFLTMLVFNIWLFGPSIIERLNVATGGHCSIPDLSMLKCRENKASEWTDGFDISGHYYFLITSSLLLLDTRLFATAEALPNTGPEAACTSLRINRLILFTRMLARFLLCIWLVEFCITSLFFHTPAEKFMGLVAIPITLSLCVLSDLICPAQREIKTIIAV